VEERLVTQLDGEPTSRATPVICREQMRDGSTRNTGVVVPLMVALTGLAVTAGIVVGRLIERLRR
jgi:hypothetical protein